MSHEEIVHTATQLFTALGAEPNHHERRHAEWQDDSLKGKFAVYETSHGYCLGTPDSHLEVKITEKWSDPATTAIASAIDVKAHGAINLTVLYRHGQLRCTFNAPDDKEKKCLDILDRLK